MLLCTNGLTDALDEARYRGDPRDRPSRVQKVCEALVARAVEEGAADDVTVLVARYRVPE